MCVEVFNDGHLVYSDCNVRNTSYDTKKNTTRVIDTTIENTTSVTNASFQNNFIILQAPIFNNTNESLQNKSVTFAIKNSTQNVSQINLFNFTSPNCCPCNATYTNSSLHFNESHSDSIPIASATSSSRCPESLTTVYHAEWLVIIVCINLFILLFGWRYTRFLRYQNAYMKKHVISSVFQKSKKKFKRVRPLEETADTSKIMRTPSAPPFIESSVSSPSIYILNDEKN